MNQINKFTNNEDINIIFDRTLETNQNIVSTISVRKKKLILKLIEMKEQHLMVKKEVNIENRRRNNI